MIVPWYKLYVFPALNVSTVYFSFRGLIESILLGLDSIDCFIIIKKYISVK